jgi:hypothetical protein
MGTGKVSPNPLKGADIQRRPIAKTWCGWFPLKGIKG